MANVINKQRAKQYAEEMIEWIYNGLTKGRGYKTLKARIKDSRFRMAVKTAHYILRNELAEKRNDTPAGSKERECIEKWYSEVSERLVTILGRLKYNSNTII